MRLRLEVDAVAHDVLRGGELLRAVGGQRLQPHLEPSETVEPHAIAGIERLRHHHNQLAQHGDDIRLLGTHVVLDVVGKFLKVPVAQALRPGIPFPLSLAPFALVLVQFVKCRHNTKNLVVNLIFPLLSLLSIVAEPADKTP